MVNPSGKSFKRAVRGTTRNPEDKTGTVQIQVRFSENNGKGNISKSLRISDAKVSDVFAAIERALFGGE